MSTVEIKERPILMHARSINGILEGRKTQTRRIIKPQSEAVGFGRSCKVAPYCTDTVWPLAYYEMRGACWNSSQPLICPYGKPGEPGWRLWVRETFSALEAFTFANPSTPEPPIPNYWYWADGQPEWGDWTRPKPSIHMPRIACRIVLEITDIRVERVQAISAVDCLAEGIAAVDGTGRTVEQKFAELWDNTNGKGAWDRNDWCWVVSFKKVQA